MRFGVELFDEAGVAWPLKAWPGWLGRGEAGEATRGASRYGLLRWVAFCFGRQGNVWSGSFWQVQVRFVAVRHGLAGKARLGALRHDVVWLDLAR